MKLVLAILGGLSLSVVTFIAGLIIAAGYYSSSHEEKHLTSNEILWTNQPVRVDAATNTLPRAPDALPEPPMSADASKTSAQLDGTMTGAIEDEASPAVEEPRLSEAHLDWCSSRYRSYRPRDNSYTPYGGGRRECVSPFSQQADHAVALSPAPNTQDSFPEEESAEVLTIAAHSMQASGAGAVRREHAAACQARYRSYRAEDNTYQPFGGGQRLPCE